MSENLHDDEEVDSNELDWCFNHILTFLETLKYDAQLLNSSPKYVF